MIKRRPTRAIWVGGVQVGGGAPISVQSMTNTDTRDVAATVNQIKQLARCGCEIVRVAVPDQTAAGAIAAIKKELAAAKINIPLIADIHFDYRLALKALKAGADGLRINPGNIGSEEKVGEVVRAAAAVGAAVRIGVNAGSLERDLLSTYGAHSPEALVESALRHIRLMERMEFFNFKVSLKSSDVPVMIKAYTMLAERVPYPLHVGVTEAGTLRTGIIKSAVGIGALLAQGIGDTIRVSLTADPCHEVWAGFEILKALGLRRRGIELISCPTCGRTQVPDLIAIATAIEERLQDLDVPLKVAVMGCVVNGPGEARDADVGVACGRGGGVLFIKGEIVRRVSAEHMVDELEAEVRRLASRAAMIEKEPGCQR